MVNWDWCQGDKLEGKFKFMDWTLKRRIPKKSMLFRHDYVFNAIPPVGLMPVELLPIESVTDQDMFFECRGIGLWPVIKSTNLQRLRRVKYIFKDLLFDCMQRNVLLLTIQRHDNVRDWTTMAARFWHTDDSATYGFWEKRPNGIVSYPSRVSLKDFSYPLRVPERTHTTPHGVLSTPERELIFNLKKLCPDP